MTNQSNQLDQQPKKTNKGKQVLIIVLALLSLILYLTLGNYLITRFLGDRHTDSTPSEEDINISVDDNTPEDTPPEKDKINAILDPKAKDGGLSAKSKEENIAALNQKVREGMNYLDFNPNPVFADGKSEGNFMIVNSGTYYAQVYEIYVEDTDQLIYSGAVDIGQSIEYSTLAVDLPKGTYDCYLEVHLVDLETGKRKGTTRTEAIMKVEILA